MKILIISTNQNSNPLPVLPFGACMVAEGVERAGHTVEFLDLMFKTNPFSEIESAVTNFKPDVVGLSIRNIDNTQMMASAYFLEDLEKIIQVISNKTSAPIVLGGASLCVMPEEILRLAKNVTCAVTGDGERVFPLLLDRIAKNESIGDIPGVAYVENGTVHRNACEISDFPHNFMAPDYLRWINVKAYMRQMTALPILSKIGCQFKCVYCTSPMSKWSSTYRLAEPEIVAEKIARYAAAGLRDFEFVDSVFNAPYDHAIKVCEAIARTGQKVRLQSDLNPFKLDSNLMKAMERAGFVGIVVTLESASNPVLKGLQKGFTSRQVYQAAEVVKQHKIPCAWMFMLGGPGETEETVKESLRFAEQYIRPQDVAFFNFGVRVYPGTALETIARNQGVLSCSPEEMLRPAYYISPGVDPGWMEQELKKYVSKNLNFIGVDAMNMPSLDAVQRLLYRLGMRPPIWRYTRLVNRGLKFMGMRK